MPSAFLHPYLEGRYSALPSFFVALETVHRAPDCGLVDGDSFFE